MATIECKSKFSFLDDEKEQSSAQESDDEVNISHQKLYLEKTSSDIPGLVMEKPENLNSIFDTYLSCIKVDIRSNETKLEKLWKKVDILEEKAKGLLKKRKRIKQRINEVEDLHGLFETNIGDAYDSMFDGSNTRRNSLKLSLKSSTSGKILTDFLNSEAETEEAELNKKSVCGITVLRMEGDIYKINQQLNIIQRQLCDTENVIEKRHVLVKRALMKLIQLVRRPNDDELVNMLDDKKTNADTLPYWGIIVIALIKSTRGKYAVEEVTVLSTLVSCKLFKQENLHSIVHMRNDVDMMKTGYSRDFILSLYADCTIASSKQGLLFTTERRSCVTPDDRHLLQNLKLKGVDIVIITIEDFCEEIPTSDFGVLHFISMYEETFPAVIPE